MSSNADAWKELLHNDYFEGCCQCEQVEGTEAEHECGATRMGGHFLFEQAIDAGRKAFLRNI
jgi:hypothetical protein